MNFIVFHQFCEIQTELIQAPSVTTSFKSLIYFRFRKFELNKLTNKTLSVVYCYSDKYKTFFLCRKRFALQRKRTRKKKRHKKKDMNCSLKSYCLTEYVLCVIDELDTCGLIERRGTSC